MPIAKFYLTILIFIALSCNTNHKGISRGEALSIAEKALVKKYGERIYNQKPFEIELKNGTWTVRGVLKCPESDNPEYVVICAGGTAEIDIDKKTGKVLRMTHTK